MKGLNKGLWNTTTSPFRYTTENWHGTQKLMVCRCFSFSKVAFSGSMFVFERVYYETFFNPWLISVEKNAMHFHHIWSARPQMTTPLATMKGGCGVVVWLCGEKRFPRQLLTHPGRIRLGHLGCIPSLKLTVAPEKDYFNRKYIFQPSFFRAMLVLGRVFSL